MSKQSSFMYGDCAEIQLGWHLSRSKLNLLIDFRARERKTLFLLRMNADFGYAELVSAHGKFRTMNRWSNGTKLITYSLFSLQL